MKIWNNFKYYGQTSIVAFSTLLLGLYISFHINYLDDPHVTPYPPPHLYTEALGFTDDWWFATLLLIVSLVLLVGITIDKLNLIVPSMVILSGVYATITIEFMLRGIFSNNITWAGFLISELFIISTMGRLGKGGERNQRHH